MRENILLYTVFLSQVLLISGYIPWKILSKVRYIVQKYPPADYARLYPASLDAMNNAQRNYRVLNAIILSIGLILILSGIVWPSKEMLNWDSQSVILIYFFLQSTPLIIIGKNPGFTFFNAARAAGSQSTRTAELRPRRLFDFVSPSLVGIAIVVYAGSISLVVAAPDRWGAGLWNVLFLTLFNLFFASVVTFFLRARKHDQYQSDAARHWQIGVNIRLAVIGAIVGTLFITLSPVLQSLGGSYQDTVQSLYFQLIVALGLAAFGIEKVDFDVYKGEPDNGRQGEPRRLEKPLLAMALIALLILSIFVFLAFEDQDDGGVAESTSGTPTSDSRFRPSAVSSKAQEKMRLGMRPISRMSNTNLPTQPGSSRIGASTSTICNSSHDATR